MNAFLPRRLVVIDETEMHGNLPSRRRSGYNDSLVRPVSSRLSQIGISAGREKVCRVD